MGKSRRPRGPRPTWEPKPPLDQAPSAAPEVPAPPEAAPAEVPAEIAVAESADVVREAVPAGDSPPSGDVSSASGLVPAAEPNEIPPDAAPALAADAAEEGAPPAVAPADLAPPVETAFLPPAIIPAEGDAVVPSAPVPHTITLRTAFAPEHLDLAGIGATIAGYMRGEGEAAAAHLRALTDARSPADLIRLQVGEVQRAADASLTCWSTVARKASRMFALR